ncbi:hypothetical protein ACVWZ4_002771 [Bradyrhizobium sp. USDA 4472]
MENPFVEAGGCSSGADTRPIQGGLATRKVCQNDELAARLAAVDKVLTGPYLCAVATMAMAFILLRFWPLNPD